MKGNEKWDKLTSLPQEYGQDSSIAERAIAEITAETAVKRRGWFARHWKKLTACVATLALAVGIAIPVYRQLTAPDPVVYYEREDLVYEAIADVGAFVGENDLSVRYFDFSSTTTKLAKIKETEGVAFLIQKFAYFSMEEGFFEEGYLRIVLNRNVELDFFAKYSELNQSTTAKNIAIQYDTRMENEAQTVFAKFTHGKVDYYLEIVTERDAKISVEAYVGMLFA